MTADTVGGVWTYALELTRALAPHGVRVLLAAMGARLSPDQREQTRKLSNVDVIESDFRLEWMDQPWEDVRRAGDWLLDLEASVKPGLVHLNGYAHGAWPWQAPAVVTAHSCVLSWWRAVKGEAAPPEWDRYRAEVTRGLHAADLVIAPSHAMLRALRECYGALPRATVIANGVRAEAFRSGRKEPFVLSAGRLWDEAKNIAALDRVAGWLPWPIRVAGEQRRPDGGCAGADHVELLGRLSCESLAQWYSRAAIYALPARYEPFGLSVLEAALSGCALVLGDIDSLRENWDGAAVFVDPDDTVALRSALTQLIQEPTRREDLARAAFARAARFSAERMADGYLAAYRSVVQARRMTCA